MGVLEQHIRASVRRIAAEPHHALTALIETRVDEALAEAAQADAAADHRRLAGVTVAVKACFDVAGWTTHAGSAVRRDDPPAQHDAAAVAALRSHGAIVVGQANMTEFAYGALGLNTTFGTPTTPLDPADERVSGGSTSGGAVAVALGMANVALGSDTSGSVRIPAAFCGVAGFKPSQGRYPDGGMLYLSPSFDVPGIIAPTAKACRRVDAALTGRPVERRLPTLAGWNFAVPASFAVEGADPEVAAAFAFWVDRLRAAGAVVTEMAVPTVATAGTIAKDGGMIATEAFMLHRHRLAVEADRYDPRVGPRIALGEHVPAHRYAAARFALRRAAAQFNADLAGIDAVLTPTVGILPPRIADLADDAAYLAANAEAFRLTEFANRLDLPSISIAADLPERAPIGLLLTGRRGGDAALLDLAVAVEQRLATA